MVGIAGNPFKILQILQKQKITTGNEPILKNSALYGAAVFVSS
jgi:hypothetical protein